MGQVKLYSENAFPTQPIFEPAPAFGAPTGAEDPANLAQIWRWAGAPGHEAMVHFFVQANAPGKPLGYISNAWYLSFWALPGKTVKGSQRDSLTAGTVATFSPSEISGRGNPLPISQTQGTRVLIPNGLASPMPVAFNIHIPKGQGFLVALFWDIGAGNLPSGTVVYGYIRGTHWASGRLTPAQLVAQQLRQSSF